MEPRDLEKLLGGYATNTLTNEERQALFDAALHDQTLFNTLADEQALKELLDHPQHRQVLLRSLQQSQPQTGAELAFAGIGLDSAKLKYRDRRKRCGRVAGIYVCRAFN